MRDLFIVLIFLQTFITIILLLILYYLKNIVKNIEDSKSDIFGLIKRIAERVEYYFNNNDIMDGAIVNIIKFTQIIIDEIN